MPVPLTKDMLKSADNMQEISAKPPAHPILKGSGIREIAITEQQWKRRSEEKDLPTANCATVFLLKLRTPTMIIKLENTEDGYALPAIWF